MAHSATLSASGYTTIQMIATTATSTYAIQRSGWGPRAAGRRRSVLGGRSRRKRVQETYILNIYGASASAVVQAYRDLVLILDQAAEWGYSGLGSAVTYTVQLDGGSSMSALIVDAEELPEAPVEFLEDLDVYAMRGVTVRFTREGALLGASESSSTSTAAQLDTVQSVTWGSSPSLPSPMTLTIALSAITPPQTFSPFSCVIAYAPSTSNLSITEAETLATGVEWTSVVEAANRYARGGNILRYTPAATTESATLTGTISGFSAIKQIAVLGKVRNNSASATYQLRAKLNTPSGFSDGTAQEIKPSEARIVDFGVFVSDQGFSGLALSAVASATGAGTLDIDCILIVALDSPAAGVVSIQSGSLVFSGATTTTLRVRDRQLTDPKPIISLQAGGGASEIYQPYVGDILLHTTGTTLATVMLAMNGLAWRVADPTALTVMTTQISATRRKTYLTPE